LKGGSGGGASLSLSLWAFCERNLKGGSFNGDPGGYVEVGFGDWHLSIGVPLGNLEGGFFFTGD